MKENPGINKIQFGGGHSLIKILPFEIHQITRHAKSVNSLPRRLHCLKGCGFRYFPVLKDTANGMETYSVATYPTDPFSGPSRKGSRGAGHYSVILIGWNWKSRLGYYAKTAKIHSLWYSPRIFPSLQSRCKERDRFENPRY